MMNMFHPEDEVMRKDETDPRNYGQVSYVWLKDMKPGQIVVRFKEDNEAIDPDTLILREEWMRLHGYTSYNQLHGYGPYTRKNGRIGGLNHNPFLQSDSYPQRRHYPSLSTSTRSRRIA